MLKKAVCALPSIRKSVYLYLVLLTTQQYVTVETVRLSLLGLNQR